MRRRYVGMTVKDTLAKYRRKEQRWSHEIEFAQSHCHVGRHVPFLEDDVVTKIIVTAITVLQSFKNLFLEY